jgi:hypothetical protein
MSQKALRAVEFIGGPFDGHVEWLSAKTGELARTGELPEHVLCYISENAFRQLHGQDATSAFSVTSVAIYALLLHGADWAYFFVKAVAPDSVVVSREESNRGDKATRDHPS